jgi:CelD/BcsL family acetyltransferase involved in cellulose biosynthesis
VPVDQLALPHLLDPEVEKRWEEDWMQDPAANIFQHPLWTKLSVAREVEPIFVNVDGAMLAARIDAQGTLRFLTDANVTDFAAPVGDPHAATALVNQLDQLAGWEHADLDGFLGDRWLSPLTAAVAARGWHPAAVEVATSPSVKLPGSFDDYLASIPSKQRHEIRRKARRLERDLAPWRTRLTSPESLQDDLDAFVAMHRLSEGDKGAFMTPEHEALFRRVGAATLDKGWLRLSWLETNDGERLAAVWSFSLRDHWLVWNSAFDPAHRELSAGMVAMGEAIRLACEERCTVFDLLRGDEPYKYRFGAQDAPVRALRFSRNGN